MPQNEYIEEHIKRHGRRLDYYERKRKREARAVHRSSATAQKAFGLKAKLLHAKRHAEKVQLKKTLKAHDERNVKQKDSSSVPDGALPTYLLDREGQKDAKALSTAIKEKRKDKAAKYAVPLPKVRGIAEDEMFKVMRTGKSKKKAWKRMVTKATFVGEGFTRKPVKMERFIRPMALRYKKANVTHPDLKATFQLQILGVKKNPQSPMYTQLGVLTKGTVIEVNVSELGMVTTGGKVVFGKYAQVTNNPENDGCINAVLPAALMSDSTTSLSTSGPVNRHAPTPVERQRAQLEKLLKDPAKPAYVPPPPKEKALRAPREMMKNVQGSSAGAGSGEFHVYKASRRREYERLKMMDEKSQQEAEANEFESKKRQWEEQAEAKTSKNRAKRQKKKERAKGKGSEKEGGAGSGSSGDVPDMPLKKRRLVSGKELVFRRPGEESDEDDEEVGPAPLDSSGSFAPPSDVVTAPVIDAPRITIIEDD
ncbi:Ribosome biogenesis protein NSA2 [Grifola frondosa]|uniref:Ribosome biogenesis protein NSA2 homolog n=1 Tax=Grifola frondosa TaxID=5627 RepID=A0A1C7LW81_GRIFR|nr:Ribosome biogenesis protein NSA2 [Grifola frondosa]